MNSTHRARALAEVTASNPAPAIRDVTEVADEGWSQWVGATTFHGEDGHVAVSIGSVANLVAHDSFPAWNHRMYVEVSA